jgi:uncharacterized protein
MPPTRLTGHEARLLGALVEKSFTTPNQYPLSLNALVNACNQKSGRDPVMTLDETAVARALATLQEKNLVGRRSEPGSRVTKFLHHIENLIGGGSAREIGTICVLLLRGAQTPGEIKTRTDRLCRFESTAEVEAVLLELAGRSDGPFVERLPRQTGQKEARYRELFSERTAPPAPRPGATPARPAKTIDPGVSLEKRIAALEAAVQDLRSRLSAEAGH